MELDDLPVLKKCCFCVPLRYGLLTWGYIKLATAILVLKLFIIIVIVLSGFIVTSRDVPLIIIIILIALILATEIVLHVIFIVGAHKKNVKLLRAYYYYAVFMWIVMLIMALVGTAFFIFIVVYSQGSRSDDILISMNVLGFFLTIVVQTFLLLSLRSEIIKLRSNCPYRFVKNENEPEGTIKSVQDEDEMSIDNGTVRIL